MSEPTAKKWKSKGPIKRVLFIRLQAFGDTIITYPYMRGFADQYPHVEIHFLTREDHSGIPKSLPFLYKTWSIKNHRNSKIRLIYLLLLYPKLVTQKFDIVFDLQNNREVRILRKLLIPKAWCAFDRFSPIPAGERVKKSIEKVLVTKIDGVFKPYKQNRNKKLQKLSGNFKVVVNPAGFYPSRNWPFNNYLEWSELVLKHLKGKVTFIFIGTDRIKFFAERFMKAFPDNTLSFVNKTTTLEAFNLIQNIDFVLTEDGGLMHMSWTTGIPTLAIFGSTRSDWSRPLGKHTDLLDSSDLPCGNCMLESCKFNDNRCLTRYSAEYVFERTLKLITQVNEGRHNS